MDDKNEEIFLINNKCNHDCIFCNLSFTNGKTIDEDTLMEDIFRRLQRLKNQNVETLMLTGGEPTLSPKNLLKVIRYAKKMGFKVKIMTNGTTPVLKHHLEKFVDAGADSFFVSLHSHIESKHDLLTRTKGSFKKTTEWLDILKEKRIDFEISFVINSINFKELKSFTKFISERYQKKTINFCLIIPEGNVTKNIWIVPRISDVIPFLIEALEYSSTNTNSITRINHNSGIPLCFLRDYIDFFEQPPRITYNESFADAKRHFNRCEKCDIFDRCGGVWKKYIEIYGKEEFKNLEEER